MTSPVIQSLTKISQQSPAAPSPATVRHGKVVGILFPSHSLMVNTGGPGATVEAVAEASLDFGTPFQPRVFIGDECDVEQDPLTFQWRVTKYTHDSVCATTTPIAAQTGYPLQTLNEKFPSFPGAPSIVTPYNLFFPPIGHGAEVTPAGQRAPGQTGTGLGYTPVMPKLVGWGKATTLGGYPQWIHVKGHVAFVLISGLGISLMDVSESNIPKLAGRIANTDCNALTLIGNNLFVIGATSLYVYDVSNPYSPTLTSTTTVDTWWSSLVSWSAPNGSDVLKSYLAYITRISLVYYLTIYDVTNPAAPSLLSHTLTAGISNNTENLFMSYDGETIFAAYFAGGSSVNFDYINVVNPASPTRVGQLAMANTPQVETLWGGVDDTYAFISVQKTATSERFLRTINVSNNAAPTQVAEIDTTTTRPFVRLWGSGRMLYGITADYNQTIFIYDATNPLAIKFLGTSASLAFYNGYASFLLDGKIYIGGRDFFNSAIGVLGIFELI